MTELRVTVTNTSNAGGTFLTPFYFGFHNGDFDLFEPGQAASAGLEAAAEDGSFGTLGGERALASPGSQNVIVFGNNNTPGTPISATETTAATVEVDGSLNTHVAYVAMILPSNDAFVGNDDALRLFSESGQFLGAQTVTIEGSDVYDAGTELNTEEDAAFINQEGPDTGLDEDGFVRLHEGFNGSEGNPDGTFGFDTPGAVEAGLTSGEQIILGGTNAFQAPITEEADFTREGAQIAELHINTVVRREGTDEADVISGFSDDDIVNAGGGADVIRGNAGYDVLNGEGGADLIFGGLGNDIIDGGTGNDIARGGAGNDLISGGEGIDVLGGNAGNDTLDGGAGGDFINGGFGDDIIIGGAGDDTVAGNQGDDLFIFTAGDGNDTIRFFDQRGDDTIALNVEGITSFEDVLSTATGVANTVTLDFGDQGSLFLLGTRLSDLDEGDFILPEPEALL
ncbi:MAG: spondin domain-containing protein [Pseudomonadota bacterium]